MNDERRGWWSRNWKWAAPGGCLIVVLLAFAGCAALVVGAMGMMKNSGAYAQAIERVKANPEAVAVLGEPIESGWLIEGRINDSGDTGEAEYSIPLSGPNGSGRLRVEARKRGGTWVFEVLQFVPDGGGAPIDLRSEGDAAPGGGGLDGSVFLDLRPGDDDGVAGALERQFLANDGGHEGPERDDDDSI